MRNLILNLIRCLCASGMLAIAGCGSAPPGGETPGAPGAPIVNAAPAVAVAPASAARTLPEYKIEVAQRLQQANAGSIYGGAPPHELRSIVVLNVVLDAAGNVKNAIVFRDNGDTETRNAAVASVHRAAPYPRPAPSVLRGGQVQFTETWLFRDDGRFVLRTLAEAYQQ